MKLIFITTFIIAANLLFSQYVVINEVLYDPDGSDGDNEWIELYNASNQSINLSGWMIQKGGSDFALVYGFDIINGYVIAPNSYLLIGEPNVQGADITTDLDFQNGGQETDGIRIISLDGDYTDTVLYDSPNTNNLPGDANNPGIFFAPDVAGGHTLARKHNGEDTDNCETDFFDCYEPTPGEANFYPIDLAVLSAELTENEGVNELVFEVVNLSTEGVDNSESTAEITINSELLEVVNLPEISAEDTISVIVQLADFIVNYNIINVTINYLYDNNLANNSVTLSNLTNASPIIINEILFKPAESNCEWLEIYNRTDSGYDVDNFVITDASGGEIRFSGAIPQNDFLVICDDANIFESNYPNVQSERIIEADSWTSLNNTEETLQLADQYETRFDSTLYSGGSCPTNFSLERVNPFDDEMIFWEISLDSLGTPAVHNSVLPLEKDLQINFLSFSLSEHIEHSVLIKNIGLEEISSAVFTCYNSKNGEATETELFQEEISLYDSVIFNFSTAIPLNGYTTYRNEIYSSEDLNISNNSVYSFFNNNALPFVVNEIMYAPANDEPEWLELKINDFIPQLEEIIIAVDDDSMTVPLSDSDYILLTGSYEDAYFLETYYNLSNIPIYYGLGSLSNNGEIITISDNYGNIIESFEYLPEWNNDLSGASIERVNPNLEANPENWGTCISGATPGAENSIFVQVLPSSSHLSIKPNPFSPYKEERTIISFKLPEVLSSVTLRIFDLKGRMINKLMNQQLQASEGEFIWDGKDKSGKKLPIGVYIILMEATSQTNEKVYSETKTVVIGK
jgi:hypothetical protein